MPSAGLAAKSALFTTLATAFATAAPDVAVTYGHPGLNPADDLVAVMGVTADQEPGPMRVGPRHREETLRLTVVVSTFRGGGPEVQPLATAQAYALLAELEDALATDPTLSGTVRWAQIESYELAEADDPDVLAAGRVAEISAVVMATARNVPTP